MLPAGLTTLLLMLLYKHQQGQQATAPQPPTVGGSITNVIVAGCLPAMVSITAWVVLVTRRGHHHPTHTKQQRAAERAGHPSNRGGSE